MSSRDQFSFVSDVVVALLKLFEMIRVEEAVPEDVSDVAAMAVVSAAGEATIGAETEGVVVAVSVSDVEVVSAVVVVS